MSPRASGCRPAGTTRRRLLTGAAGMAATALGAPAGAQGPVTLRFLWWGGSDRHARTLKALQAFEAGHPGLRVKAEYMGFNGYLEKLTTQMVGGTEPDLLQINWAWLAMFSRQGTGFLDLNAHQASLPLVDYTPDDLALCTVQGKLNGLPLSYTARVFLWNTAAFQRAGLAPPSGWDELYAAGPVFKQRLGERAYPIDGEPYDMLLLAQTYIQQRHGTPYLHPSEPRVAMSREVLVEWVQTFERLYASGTATPVPYRASLGGAEKPIEQQPDWVVGRWAGNYTWDSAIRLRQSTLDAAQRLDVGDFLTLPGARTSGMFGRPALLFSVSKHTKHPEAAVALLRYLAASPEAAALLGVTRGIPSAATARAALERAGALPALERKAAEQIRQQREAGRLELPAMRFEDARFRRLLREVFERVAYRRISAPDAAQRLLDEGNALSRKIR